MSLRTTTFFIIAMILLGLVVVLFGTLNGVLPSYFQQQEQADAILNARRGAAVIESQLDELQRLGAVAVSHGSNLPADAALLAADADLYVEVDTAGPEGRLLSIDGGTYGKVPDELGERLDQLISSSGSATRGVMDVDGTPMLLVVLPEPGSAGIVVGRFLDSTLQQSLADQLKLLVAVIPYGDPNASDDYSYVRAQFAAGQSEVVQILSSDLAAGYTLMKDPAGNPAFILETSQPRTYYRSSQLVMNSLTVALVSSTAIFSLMTFLLIEMLILRRLSKLNREVMAIALDGRSLPRVTITRRDEIASLGKNVNAMLDRLEAARDELEQSYIQVRQGRNRLEDLSRRLVDVQEQERKSIAIELHDEIGQSLTALKLRLERLNQSSPVKMDEVKQTQAILNDLVERVRDLSLQLRPAMLDDLGLLPTLLWFFEQYTRQTGIAIQFDHQGLEKMRFPQQVELTAYRVIQEGLTNTARHAGVKTASVSVDHVQHSLNIQIRDAGVGFNVEKVLQSAKTAGLSGMRERVAVIGGKFEIRARKGRGTTLSIELPFKGRVERRARARHDPAG